MIRPGFSERRKDRRVYSKIPMSCEFIDPQNQSAIKKNVLINNINSESVYFESDEIIALDTELKVSFQLQKNGTAINAALKVIRVERIQEGKFGIGAKFIQLQDQFRDEIKQLVERLDVNRLLEKAIKKGASDLHLLVEQPPMVRLFGELVALEDEKLHAEDISRLLYSIMTREQIRSFEQEKELNFSVQFDTQNRFRTNLHQQRGFLEATLRLINAKISSFEELNIPDAVKDLVRLREGLILIAGPTNSGKTTTIAAMVELINHERRSVIITLERPIEYLHVNAKSVVKQREVGVDTYSFSAALKNSLRQDPNVIVIGELEDIETIRTAIIAAEAGHLVIASFHAPNTIQAIDRLISIFSLDSRRHILSQLSHCLRGVVTQLLIPRQDKKGRVLVTEILTATEAAKRVIRNDELIQVPNIIQTGAAYKMQSMQESIKRAVECGLIDFETANFYSQEFSKYTH